MRSPIVHTLRAWETVIQTDHERSEESSGERQYIYMGGELRDTFLTLLYISGETGKRTKNDVRERSIINRGVNIYIVSVRWRFGILS